MKISELWGSVGICLCVVGTVTLAGCGGSSTPMSSLKGTVTYQGKPVADAKVQVQSGTTGAAGMGRTDAAGNYAIETPLPLGQYVVSVVPDAAPVPAPPPPNYVPQDNPKIPKKYRTAATSGLTWDAKKGACKLDIPMVD